VPLQRSSEVQNVHGESSTTPLAVRTSVSLFCSAVWPPPTPGKGRGECLSSPGAVLPKGGGRGGGGPEGLQRKGEGCGKGEGGIRRGGVGKRRWSSSAVLKPCWPLAQGMQSRAQRALHSPPSHEHTSSREVTRETKGQYR